jgi:small subunit ribosomal protein S18
LRRAHLKGSTNGYGSHAQAEEEGFQFCKEKATGVDGGYHAAPQVHLRPRQDPRASGDWHRVQHQRDVAIAVKNARELALLPYTSTGR